MTAISAIRLVLQSWLARRQILERRNGQRHLLRDAESEGRDFESKGAPFFEQIRHFLAKRSQGRFGFTGVLAGDLPRATHTAACRLQA
jgi:hypothetical protein